MENKPQLKKLTEITDLVLDKLGAQPLSPTEMALKKKITDIFTELNEEERLIASAYLSTGKESETADMLGIEKKRVSAVLKHIKVKQALTLSGLLLQSRTSTAAEDLVRKLKLFIDTRVTDFFDIIDGKLIVKDFSKIPEDKISAIQSIKETKYGLEIKLVSKLEAIDLLSRLLGIEQSQKENSANVNIENASFRIEVRDLTSEAVGILPNHNEEGIENADFEELP